MVKAHQLPSTSVVREILGLVNGKIWAANDALEIFYLIFIINNCVELYLEPWLTLSLMKS